jgi:hypothetical protein
LSTDEQDARPGSVPVAYGNALSWKWTRQMSTYLRRSGLPLLLCQLRNFANASGEVAFSGDRKPIRLSDIAAAACCREKDGRRYLEAAIRAGVVQVVGQRKRGAATRYVIVVHPFPDWQAAEDYLKSTARKPGAKAPEWADDEDGSSGHRGPIEKGPPRPELPADPGPEEGATAARMGSGHRGPNGSGHRGPNNPGGYPGFSQDRAEVVPQPQPSGPTGEQIDHQEHHHERPNAGPPPAATAGRCRICQIPLIRPGRDLCHGCEQHLAAHPTDHERHSA